MNDRTKLPKWAQSELRGLEREVLELRRQLDVLAAPSTSRERDLAPGAYYQSLDGAGQPVSRRIPGDRITLVLPDQVVVEVHPDARRHYRNPERAPSTLRGVTVRTNSGPLRVLPSASNVVFIAEEEF